MLLVIGIDAATWKIIKPNIDRLPNIRGLMDEGIYKTLPSDKRPISASAWCSIFSGKMPEEHKNTDFVVDGELQTREKIRVDFIWDVLDKQGYDVKALNIPFVIPPYNFNCGFKPVGYGLPETPGEWGEELHEITEKSLEILNGKPDLLCVAYSLLDRVQHFHWGEEEFITRWYEKVDKAIGNLIPYGDKLIVLSDHGFCNREEAEVQTLPEKTPRGEIKGDHHRDGILITKNVDFEINRLQDVYFAIKKEIKNG
ncbi:MAG: hypothetical protein A7316_02025 [Candidatus Altiarchaeales archaeon WOR_SM1_86-2]|nr:MAG: hypothetical protein A7316_02025 [Candidatus Altiarchaeales archaeon WOR_SM1_86-2]ODS41574.1 MAG: hypothetical protein A7315_01420 [Candidatus Altiarchaeales archaeon WOR_SM1_79]